MTVSAPAWSPPRPPGRHAGPWVSPAVPVEQRPRHTGRGTGVRGQGPAPARRDWPRVPTSGYRAGFCTRPPGQCAPDPGQGRPQGRGDPTPTHQPPPARTRPGQPFQKAGRTGTHPSRRGAHRDLPLQRQGAPGVDFSRTECTGVEPSRKWSAQRPTPLPAHAPRAPPRCTPQGRTPVPVPGGMGRACTSLGTSPRGWPGKQGGREGRPGGAICHDPGSSPRANSRAGLRVTGWVCVSG